MLKNHILNWSELPSNTTGQGSPYDGASVLLCLDYDIFEACWTTARSINFDVKYALDNKIEGYWRQSAHELKLNFSHEEYPVLWAPLPKPFQYEKDIKKAMEELTEMDDQVESRLILECPYWIDVKEYVRESWLDSSGYYVTHKDSFNGIVIEVPKRSKFSAKKWDFGKIHGEAMPLWR